MSPPEFLTNFLDFRTGPDLPSARNKVTELFLETFDANWLMMIDSDMTFSYSEIVNMHHVVTHSPDNIKMLSGLAYISDSEIAGVDTIQPNWWKINPDADWSLPPITAEELQPNTLAEIGACGAACIMVHRSVFEKIGGSWFNRMNLPTDEDQQLGEDLSFCVRAKRAGFKIYGHSGIEFGHAKTQVITSRSLERKGDRGIGIVK